MSSVGTSADFDVARTCRLVLEAAQKPFVIFDDETIIRFVNDSAERFFGEPARALVGRRLEALLAPGSREHFARVLAQTAGSLGTSAAMPVRVLERGEIEHRGSVRLTVVRDREHLAVAAWFTQEARGEFTHDVMADRLLSAIESIGDAIGIFDPQERLVICNTAYRRLVERTPTRPIDGRRYAELLDEWIDDFHFSSPEERERYRAHRLARARGPDTLTFDLRLRDGRVLRVTDQLTPDGGSVKTIANLTDDFRIAEELRHARAVAEEASSAKSEFLSSMSHELRTPLNSILGFAQLLLRDRKLPLAERHVERTKNILTSGEHLLRLIDDILDLSRIEAGGVSVSPEPLDLRELLAQVGMTLEPLASARHVKLAFEPLDEGIPSVRADRTRLVQVLVNLGSNAIKYNRPDGRVTYRVALMNDMVRVVVSDTGVGIPLDKQDRIFQPFQRAGQENGGIEGTGIGLVITQRLARLMGGEVGFVSRPNEGSDFWVELPIADGRLRQRSTRLARVLTDELGVGKKIVLYVEDNPANVAFMRDLLGTLQNVALVTAPDAERGLALAHEVVPDLVIMDINLPGMNGIEALAALRRAHDTRRIPVIALSAATEERDIRRGMSAGFYRYLTKPLDVDMLLSTLELLLAPASKAPSGAE